MKEKNPCATVNVTKDIVEELSGRIDRKRREVYGAIEKQAGELRNDVMANYAEIERLHRMLLSGIQSVVKGSQFEKDIRDAAMRPLKKLPLINEASKALDKLLEEGK